MPWMAAAFYVMAAATVASTAMSVYSASQQAQNAKKTREYNEAVARNNMEIARQQSELKAKHLEDKMRKVESMNRAKIGKGGLAFTSDAGTVEDLIDQNAEQFALEKEMALYEGKIGVMREQEQSDLTSMQLRGTERAAYGSMLSSGIGAVRGAASSYTDYQIGKKKGYYE